MILQRPRIIVVDAGFEPETSASEVWRATVPMSHHISGLEKGFYKFIKEKFQF